MSRKKGTLANAIGRRAYVALGIGITIYGLLIYRLSYIQIIQGKMYTEKSQNQSLEKVDLNSGRGIIYDRNGKNLTDIDKKTILIVQKEKLIKDYKIRGLVQKAAKINDVELYKNLEEQISSSVVEIEVSNIDSNLRKELKENDILVDTKTLRYSSNGLLANTIGYIYSTDKVGASGIEKSLDYLLKDSNEKYVSAFKAGQSGNQGNKNLGILKGSIKTVKQSKNDKNIRLTIDKDIQQQVEDTVNKEENPSSVVISDVDTGEILAISSRPTFNPNNIAQYNNSTKGELYNRAIQAIYPPGSVFKIVVLYAALESGVIDQNYTYNCTGSVKIGKDNEILRCHKLDGHGIETLQQAFSNSCNPAFYDIAKKLGKEKVIAAAKKLHLEEKVNIGIYEEKNKTIPEDIALRNLAIGQGSMGFTPLQINQLTQIIANNGTYKPLYLFDSVVDTNKNIVKVFKQSKKEEIISPYTSTIVKEMMKDVSEEGTAKELSDLTGGSGVKTGTAQTTVNGNQVTHGWITGFYPKNQPKYAITVILEGTEKSSKSAVPIFKEICEKINKK
ncbi:peptidoglycan D,D-transpeptidase FtsI family protein [Romboutsia sp.]|uniref:peptidoglycan D,D-transpeptidase FtsI family protein n=1 Tax=Romboutsia sp. TaxID=1965302 RepID=UPI003F3A87B2